MRVIPLSPNSPFNFLGYNIHIEDPKQSIDNLLPHSPNSSTLPPKQTNKLTNILQTRPKNLEEKKEKEKEKISLVLLNKSEGICLKLKEMNHFLNYDWQWEYEELC